MWLYHMEHMAQEAQMTLKEAVSAKAGPTVLTVISKYPNATDAEVKWIILECFSNVGTKVEASHYIKKMRLDKNSALMTHNAEYAAVHAVAHDMTPEEQTDQQVLQSYANTLGNLIASKLNRKILRKRSYIRTLKDTMEEAETLKTLGRQEEISRLERNSMRETTISEFINMISDASVNYIDTPRGDHFNSTMKQNYSPNSWNNYNNGYNNSSKYDNSYQNIFSKRRLNRYRHQPQWPKKNIKFEYNARDKNMMGNIRRTVNYIKEGA